jgi:hypothetical protein
MIFGDDRFGVGFPLEKFLRRARNPAESATKRF